MEKRVNKLKKSMTKFKIALLLLSIIITNFANAQEVITNESKETQVKTDTIVAKDTIAPRTFGPINFKADNKYEIGGISVTGLKKFEEQTVKVFTGLKVGQEIKLPGDKLTSAIKKLYETNQFSNIDVYVSQIDGECDR